MNENIGMAVAASRQSAVFFPLFAALCRDAATPINFRIPEITGVLPKSSQGRASVLASHGGARMTSKTGLVRSPLVSSYNSQNWKTLWITVRLTQEESS